MPLLGYSLVTSGNTPLFTQIKKQIAVKAIAIRMIRLIYDHRSLTRIPFLAR